MKQKLKQLLLIVVLTIISVVFISFKSKAEQSDTSKVTVSTVYNDVKNGINKNEPRVEKAVQSLAKDLKVSADKVWDILVKQQKVWSIGYLLGELVAVWCWCHFWYRMKQGRENEWEDSGVIMAPWITIVLAMFFSIVSITHFNDMLTGFFNPEYGAMKTIAEVADSLKP